MMEILTVTLNPALDREFVVPNFTNNKLYRIFDRDKMIMDPGGKGINVSTMLDSFAQIPSIAMGFLGGYSGRVISEELRKRYPDVTLNFIHTDGESRENISILDEINHSITEINAPGPYILESDLLHFMRLYKTTVSHTNITLISGSVPMGIPLDIYATLTDIAREKGNRVFMEARGSLLTNAVKYSCPHVVRPDMRSSKKILGKELESLKDYIEAGEEIVRYGAELVIISYKMISDLIITADGCWMMTKKDEILDESHLMGTGDACMAAMIYYSLKNSDVDFKEMGKFGMAAAIANTKSVTKDITTVKDVKEAMDDIKVERIR